MKARNERERKQKENMKHETRIKTRNKSWKDIKRKERRKSWKAYLQVLLCLLACSLHNLNESKHKIYIVKKEIRVYKNHFLKYHPKVPQKIYEFP
jgi:hypothetical protein